MSDASKCVSDGFIGGSKCVSDASTGSKCVCLSEEEHEEEEDRVGGGQETGKHWRVGSLHCPYQQAPISLTHP